jgi:hypothetical protein
MNNPEKPISTLKLIGMILLLFITGKWGTLKELWRFTRAREDLPKRLDEQRKDRIRNPDKYRGKD